MPIRLLFTLIVFGLLGASVALAGNATPDQTAAPDQALETISLTIVSLGNDNGIDLAAYASTQGSELNIKAVMTDENDSIDYISGYLSRENTLAMLAPHLASFLMANPEITIVNGSITDHAGQSIKLNYTSIEVLESLSIH